MMNQILVFLSNGRQYKVPLNKPDISIGRSHDNQIVIPDALISDHHATVHVARNNEIIIEDSGSLNGIYLNGRKIQKAKIGSHDQIRIGKQVFERFQVTGTESVKKEFQVSAVPASMKAQPELKTAVTTGGNRTKWIIGLAVGIPLLILIIVLIALGVSKMNAKAQLMRVHENVMTFISQHPELMQNLDSYPQRTAVIRDKFALLEQYHGHYNKIRNLYSDLNSNILLKATALVMAPGMKNGLDAAFSGIDKLYSAGDNITTISQSAPELSQDIKNYSIMAMADKSKLNELVSECARYQSSTTEFLSGLTETKSTMTSIRQNVQGFMNAINSLAGNSTFVEIFFFFDDFVKVLGQFELEMDGFMQPYTKDMETVQQLSDLITEK